jgi:hypothetical protein
MMEHAGVVQWSGVGAGIPAGYAELQLRLARRAVSIESHGFGDAVGQLTTFHRRFGFGDPCDRPCVAWIRYLDGLDARPDLTDQVRWTIEFAASSRVTPPPPAAVARAGPFSVHVHGDLLRTHSVRPAPYARRCTGSRARPRGGSSWAIGAV